MGCLDVKGLECHAIVHACRDIASRCACDACTSDAKGWQALCKCCFCLIDACDSYCHQRVSLPQMLKMCDSDECDMRCAFRSGPHIPGTSPYRPASKVTRKCCVYCANSSCGADRSYCDSLPQDVQHVCYPGGLLEYYCRTQMPGSTLPELQKFHPQRFRHRTCKHKCVP